MSEKQVTSWKRLLMVLFLEAITVVAIIAIFKLVEPRLWAARWASMSFVIECVLILLILWPWRHKSGKGKWTLTVFVTVIFLGVFVLPMTVFRWATTEQFIHLKWLGMTGPVLHNWSSIFYYVLVGATVLDFIYALYVRLPENEVNS